MPFPPLDTTPYKATFNIYLCDEVHLKVSLGYIQKHLWAWANPEQWLGLSFSCPNQPCGAPRLSARLPAPKHPVQPFAAFPGLGSVLPVQNDWHCWSSAKSCTHISGLHRIRNPAARRWEKGKLIPWLPFLCLYPGCAIRIFVFGLFERWNSARLRHFC